MFKKDKKDLRIEELEDKVKRQLAEFENFRKRTLKEKADLILNGGEKTVKAILPILDDFERAITQAEKSDDITAIREGMELIFKKLLKTLEGQGVQKIDTTDQDFNTDYHEAVALVPGMGDDKKGKVIDCVQTGYMLNEKVICIFIRNHIDRILQNRFDGKTGKVIIVLCLNALFNQSGFGQCQRIRFYI